MNKCNEIYRRRINKVIDYATENLDKSISLEELAAQAMFSPYHFHRIFAALTGETVNQFTSRIRNEKAARLLRFSRKSISAIATECGFSSASTLSRSFRAYFQLSPTDYRQGMELKNSKICKVPPSSNDYYCGMTAEELAEKFPVEIRQLPERRVAYIRVPDAFSDGVVLRAFEDLVKWAKSVGLFEKETIFGMSMDDPDVTPREKYRYEACITIPRDWKMESTGPVETMTLPKCRYAVTFVNGGFDLVTAATNYLIDIWLINSSFEHEHQHGLEVFKNKEKVCDWSRFELELFVPIKTLKNI